MITYFIRLYNEKSGKETIRKAKGQSRLNALLYLCEKIRHPENYTVLKISSDINAVV